MQTHNLGYPRIGNQRQLKRACERFWAGKISREELHATGRELRHQHWQLQREAGIDLVPCNDFSYYDQVLDMAVAVGAVPPRYRAVAAPDRYFAMARGYQQGGIDVRALEMTKWFDTNYHYLVPEFTREQSFAASPTRLVEEYREARALGIPAKPVLLGPVSFLLLGKEKEDGFHRTDLIERLLPVYLALLTELQQAGAAWIQFDEPYLALDLSDTDHRALVYAYGTIRKHFPTLRLLLTSYFDDYGDNLATALSLPVDALHLDLARRPEQLAKVLDHPDLPDRLHLSLGVVDGRNVWKNDYRRSLQLIDRAVAARGSERILLAPSCSLLHVPCDLDLETDEEALPPDIKEWLAFARQKLDEVVTLRQLALDRTTADGRERLRANREVMDRRSSSPLIHRSTVNERVNNLTEAATRRKRPYAVRQELQSEALALPLFPTTTIGSFPQTPELRKQRANYKRGEVTAAAYTAFLERETERVIRWQEEVGLDVLVHGEFERNDMVEYFGEQLAGFAFTRMGWVQSYGSRCVKPPIIYGDVYRPVAMTVRWSVYAQSLTERPVKGMLTGPVTILQWSFVRDDQPRSRTCTQIALAIRDEVSDLEAAGIRIIQIDEPAIREGLPLRQRDWPAYLEWAVRAFRIASSGVKDGTQVHTHMCYSEFNDILPHIAAMDADVISIECSRSQMELLDAFGEFAYPNEIGPGVYDIHSPRLPSRGEMVRLLQRAASVIAPRQLWVNPDCGLKTRRWEETQPALVELVAAAALMRQLTPQDRV